MLDVAKIRADFPVLDQLVRDGKKLVYLDSAATSQKPLQVLDAERNFLLESNAAVHRGAHALAERATIEYENARTKIARFVGSSSDSLVFVRNATEAINLVAYSFSNATVLANRGQKMDPRFVLNAGDEILLTSMEHHSNLVPWQELASKTGAILKFVDIDDDGRLQMSHFDSLLNSRTRVVAAVHQSNILGTVNPIEKIVAGARSVAALVLIDACQSIPHSPFSFESIGADFVVFSGHKMLGPTGLGALVAKPELLEAMPPFLTGGSMIETVQLETSTFAKGTQRFEAGSPNVSQAIGLAAAVDYLSGLGMKNVELHESALTKLALNLLKDIPGVRIIGPENTENRGGAISFIVEGIHPHDVGQVLDSHGVAVRVGHHCAWPVCRRYNVPATTRASFYVYNTSAEVEKLAESIVLAQEFFGVK